MLHTSCDDQDVENRSSVSESAPVGEEPGVNKKNPSRCLFFPSPSLSFTPVTIHPRQKKAKSQQCPAAVIDRLIHITDPFFNE